MAKDESFIKYANSFQAIARLKLEGITELMKKLGDPQDSLKFIHVAGTNGKGSVCCFLQGILSDSGYKTGRYMSPNMLRVNERISIDNVDISDDDINRILSIVEEKAKEMEQMPTQFEIWTAAAFCYFNEQKCDYVVLEVGLGGECDATNVIKEPMISVITKIAVDHTSYLGNTLCEIARAKAGIIKKCTKKGYTVTIDQDEEVINVLKEKANECDNEFILTKKPKLYDYNGKYEVFDYDDMSDIRIGMLGVHQSENASLAIECAKILGIDEKYIKSGIFKAKNIGRLDVIMKEPYILFDGAHNKNCMKALSEAILRYFPNKKKCFIMGFMKDKDISGAVGELVGKGIIENSSVYTVTVKNNERAATAKELSDILSENGIGSIPCDSIHDAVNKASSEEMIIICGSLYLYKDLYEDHMGKVDKKDN